MILNIPALPPSPNLLRRQYRDPHAYKKLRTNWEHDLMYAPAGSQSREHWRRTVQGDVRIRLDVRFYHKGTYDPDNLTGALKVVIDALRNVGYLKDDSPKYFELGDVEQIVSNEPPATVLYLSIASESRTAPSRTTQQKEKHK